MSADEERFELILETLRRSAAALRDAEIPFVLGGSIACWARGGPRSQNDLDLMLPRQDAERAYTMLVDAGMRGERPPERWLLKVFDEGVMIDLIHECLGIGSITPQVLAGAERMSVLAIDMPVMSLEDILVGKLLAVSEQRLDYGSPLEIARALRERVDWRQVRDRTHGSPYARAFMALLEQLDIVGADTSGASARQLPWRPAAA
jgi:predicted nucleotidyltransferase